MKNALFHAPIRITNNLLSLMFPTVCIGCNTNQVGLETHFCLECQYKIRLTDQLNTKENDFTQRLWGRVPLVSGAALYHFHKKSPLQHAMHLLKYMNRPDIAQKFGREIGSVMKNISWYQDIQIIVPVPLHPKKEKIRGYNQSEEFAKGISEVLQVPIARDALLRKSHGITQTRLSRQERHTNAESAFRLHKSADLQGKYILLVDDVLTTGATMEQCAQLLSTLQGIRLSAATIALAE